MIKNIKISKHVKQGLRATCLKLLAAVLALMGSDAFAMTQTGTLAGVDYQVFAPDWTWQKRDINMLVVLSNRQEADVTVDLDLAFPESKEDHFSHAGQRAAQIIVPPHETVRHAFTAITALDGYPLQVYEFSLGLGVRGQDIAISYPVKTIRGAAVRPGQWALYLPAGLALLWSLVFMGVLPRFATRGAWRVPGKPVRVEEEPEAWIEQTTK